MKGKSGKQKRMIILKTHIDRMTIQRCDQLKSDLKIH